MPTAACLDAGFFVGGEDEFTVFQGMPQPHSLIQVEDTPRFFGEMGVSREKPSSDAAKGGWRPHGASARRWSC